MKSYNQSILSCLFFLLSLSAQADVCITFASSADNFEGKLTAHGNGFSTITMLETAFDRPAYGSLKKTGSTLFMGWTKNTNIATVKYQCVIDMIQKDGPCSILVFFADPLDARLIDDVANIQFGNCSRTTTIQSQENFYLPPGE